LANDPNIPVTVLAFDLGASSGRALIGRLQAGEQGRVLEVRELHRFPNHAIQVGNHLHWDILRLLHEVKQGIMKAFQSGDHPRTFGIDTWGVDFGLLDADGELLGNPYHYRDPQTEGLIDEICELEGKDRLYRESGIQFMPFNTIYQLYAMRKASSPKLDCAETLLLTPDLLVYLLTGVRACEYTMATTTQLMLPGTRTWNVELMGQLGIPSRLFLKPVEPGTIVGPLSREVREELGGVPAMKAVAVGTHDTESAVAAIPAAPGAFAYIVCGTWSLLGTEREQPIVTQATQAMDWSNEGGVGGKYQLLKNIMGLWILQECKREWDEEGRGSNSYTELVQSAEAAAPLRCFIEPDDLRFYSPGGMIQKVQDYCRDNGQPVPESQGEIVRCILESLALRYRESLEQAEQLATERFEGLHMVGGGIQNRLLCQFTANALGRPVWAGPVEASAIGNMLLQLIALGDCADLQEARALSAASFPVEVYEPEACDSWDEAYARYRQLQKLQ
jgi:rhamnulokinase